MEDRVADVLAQRAALDRGAGTAIALSILLHGGASVLIAFSAMRTKPVEKTNALNVTFTPIAAAAPKPKPAAPRIEEPKPVPVTPPTPAPKPAAPPEKNVAPPSPFGQSAKKPSENVEPPKPKPPASPAATATTGTPGISSTADVPVGGTGVTGIEGGDFPYTIYIDRMKTLVGGRWYRPGAATPNTTATVYFVIERDGTIRDAKVEKPSGNGTFDRAALRSVIESSPLPPLPFGYSGTYLGVHLTFK